MNYVEHQREEPGPPAGSSPGAKSAGLPVCHGGCGVEEDQSEPTSATRGAPLPTAHRISGNAPSSEALASHRNSSNSRRTASNCSSDIRERPEFGGVGVTS
jgi:hypothetical protein